MNIFDITRIFLIDPLSLFFVITILLISILSAIYSIGYLKDSYSANKITLNWVLLTLFTASMLFVVTTGNALLFLFAWEIMSLTSYFLVVFDNEEDKAVKAGIIYIVMAHIGTAFITVAFLLMYKHAGTFDFEALKTACRTMPGTTKNLVFILLFLGFGTKAGIVPLHIWLPYAHPQAPSHISSIMSGVMIKTAIYGMIRFIIYILGINSAWWGQVVLVIASISCIAGVMYALMEHDLKKLLAYCSVENIGIILLGIGAAMVFISINQPILAVLSMTAGLYHLINHAIFKSLLFLCAGSVYKATTGIRNMEDLGGLIKTMPLTALSFLFGAMAISALPPLNGFISEWLTLQSLFFGALNGNGYYRIFFSVTAAVLALTSGLAAACFVKAFGITFLAMPRSDAARNAKDPSPVMTSVTIIMSFLTILFGLASVPVIRWLSGVSSNITGININGTTFALNNFTICTDATSRVYMSSTILALTLVVAIGIIAVIVFRKTMNNKIVETRTWGCGYYNLDARTEYTATAFSTPFKIAFSFLLLPHSKTVKTRIAPYYIKSFKYETTTASVFKQYIYDIAINIIYTLAMRVRKIQPGSIQIYLGYIFITIILLIIFMNRF
ncbi:MAG: proton-conducting transporter membrane subunit [Elusimicrobiota bacterium]